MTSITTQEPLWCPSRERVDASHLNRFAARIEALAGERFDDYEALWRWTVDEPVAFWREVWRYCDVIGELPDDDPGMVNQDRMPGAKFFPTATLNYAENCLRGRGEDAAIVFRGEDKVERELSWDDLHNDVSRIAQALRDSGVGAGDRVAAILPHMPEAVTCMLASASVGAVWSSCSPDFGVDGVVERFAQIEPRVLFAVDGYFLSGKARDCLEKLRDIAKRLPTVERIVVVGYQCVEPELTGIDKAVGFDAYVAPFEPEPIEYEQLPFNHPLFILYSSGTTGAPKCIVHGAGGTLLQHLKEHALHCDVRAGDRVFYATTCSWMMWNWQVSALASKATLLLYDGSPFYPTTDVLFRYAASQGMTLFGTAAKYLDACRKADLELGDDIDLSALRTLTSTGSPLVAETFDYVYGSIKRDLHVASISGGTDIISCFVLGNPCAAVWRGEIQVRGLGLAVDVFDEQGAPVRGVKGELVCTRPFPCMPIGFWNDKDGSKYRMAYFDRFPGIWTHGDWAELTDRGSMIIYGRSDAVLKPGGVRIGTAEIYRQVEQVDEVLESIVVGQEHDDDVRVVLFVKLRPDVVLDMPLIRKIQRQVRSNTTPAHVPTKIVQVDDIPRTKSGKIVELAVREIVHGRPVKNLSALANPEALAGYRERPELAD